MTNNEEQMIIDGHRGICSVALGIIGTKKEIELRHNSLYNFGATSATELNWISDELAYTWVGIENLKNYFLKSSMAMLINNKADGFGKAFKGRKGSGMGALQRAKEIAKERMAKVKQKRFLPNYFRFNPETYEVTNIQYDY